MLFTPDTGDFVMLTSGFSGNQQQLMVCAILEYIKVLAVVYFYFSSLRLFISDEISFA